TLVKMMRAWALLALVVAAGPVAAAPKPQDDDEPAPAEAAPARDAEEAPASPRGAGEPNPGGYRGVAPGAQNLPPHPPRLPIKRGPQRMTWPGFQMRDGVP